jgi:co-chaperonin GroES (HSP10)
MRLKAVGRHLIVRAELERVEKQTKSGLVIPREAVENEEGGVQFFTVLDVGQYAFDDQPDMAALVKPGITIATVRYPGSTLYTKTEWDDKTDVSPYRIILDTEVRAVIDDSGAQIDE